MTQNFKVKILILFLVFLFSVFIFLKIDTLENQNKLNTVINSLKLTNLINKNNLKNHKKVLSISKFSNSSFYIDLNSNNTIDENELIKIKGIEVFSPYLSATTRIQAKNLNLSVQEYLKNGFLARKWIEKNLKENYVEVKNLSKHNSKEYFLADLYINNENLAKILLRNGLAYITQENTNSDYYQSLNLKQAKYNAKELSKLKFTIINTKSGVQHKLNCEHIEKIALGQIILQKEGMFLGNTYCKTCFKKNRPKRNEFFIPKSKKHYKKSIYINSNTNELYLINPLEYNKPNKNCDTIICKRILKEIQNSTSKIDLALYGIGEQKEIINALKDAKNRGVKIRVVADFSKNMDNIYPDTKKFISDFQGKTDNNETLMHNKFIIFDEKLLMTGSMNISPAGSGGYNANNVFFTKNKQIIDKYLHEFEQMYNNKFSIFKNKNNNEYNLQNLNAYFSPQDNILEKVILPKIKSANQAIYLSVFYLTEKKLIEELINAKNRGVEVLVLIDALSANNFKDRIIELRKNNIPTIVENWGGKNHEKTILFDFKELLIGSCNFSKSGFYKNDENVVVIKDEKITKTYADYFLYLYNSIDKKYLYQIPRAEGFESKNSCFDEIDNNHDNKIDIEDNGCKIINKK